MNLHQRAWRQLGKWLAFSAIAASSSGALASDFSVGWVTVKFAEPGWRSLPLADTKQEYSGDKSGALAVNSKVFLRDATATGGQVIVVVRATPGALTDDGTMVYAPNCKSDSLNYREGNTGFSTTFLQCLTVTPPYDSSTMLGQIEPELLALRDKGELQVSQRLFLISSYHAVSTGALMDVRVFVASPLTADAGQIKQELPGPVLPTQVAWGRMLKDAVKSTMHSFPGRLVFPSIP